MAGSDPTVSIIVEWENVRLSEMDRCRRMLRQLDVQTRELGAELRTDDRVRPIELLILFNREHFEKADLRRLVEDCFVADHPYTELTLIPVDDLPYYEQKNYGAQHARGELIVFLDSDVIPESGWLTTLVHSFDNSAVNVVAGNAYIEPEDIYSKAFALFWFFPLRVKEGALAEASHFLANNVAFRAETFRRFRFPTSRDVSRGACVRMAENLRENGIAIYRNTKCQVSHPAPNGVSHFVRRGLAQGRDLWFALETVNPRKASLVGATGRFLKAAFRSSIRVFRFRREVGMSLVGAPVAAALGIAYYGFCYSGEVLTWINPDYMRTNFHL